MQLLAFSERCRLLGWVGYAIGVGGFIPPTLIAAKLLGPSGLSVTKSYTIVRLGEWFWDEGFGRIWSWLMCSGTIGQVVTDIQ